MCETGPVVAEPVAARTAGRPGLGRAREGRVGHRMGQVPALRVTDRAGPDGARGRGPPLHSGHLQGQVCPGGTLDGEELVGGAPLGVGSGQEGRMALSTPTQSGGQDPGQLWLQTCLEAGLGYAPPLGGLKPRLR